MDSCSSKIVKEHSEKGHTDPFFLAIYYMFMILRYHNKINRHN